MKKSAVGHFRRFKGYDYSRGGSIFITATLAERRPLFGEIDHDRVKPSVAGEMLAAAIEKVKGEFAGRVALVKSVIMPDHYHARLVFAAGLEDPVAQIGNFVGRIKQYSQYHIKKAGLCESGLWAEGYHDHLSVSRFINEKIDRYIENNPLKWSLMFGEGVLKVREPIVSERLNPGEWWRFVCNPAAESNPIKGLHQVEEGLGESGNGSGGATWRDPVERLVEPTWRDPFTGSRICAVQLSRRLAERDYPAVLARLLDGAAKGYTFAGTFISPLERRLYAKLAEKGYPIIKATPDPLDMVYRPKDDEPLLFDRGQLVLVSRECDPTEGRYAAWHGINSALGAMADYDLYVRAGPDGAPRWLFGEAAEVARKAVVRR